MIVPPLTRPRVKLGTIAREKAAAAEGFPLTVRVVATGPVAPGKSRRRDGLPFAHGRAALMKRLGLSSFAAGRCGLVGPERLTGPRMPCGEEMAISVHSHSRPP